MYQIIIVDDNPVHQQIAHKAVREQLTEAEHEIVCFSSMEDLKFCETLCPHIAVLDIELNSSDNGIDVARYLSNKFPCCQIIFLTSFIDYVSDAYDVPHIYLVLKQDLNVYLEKALNKALQQLQQLDDQVLIVRDSLFETHQIIQSEIIYAERVGKYSFIHTTGGIIKTAQSISSLYTLLNEKCFARCHQSFFVNFYFAKTVRSTEICFDNGVVIPISRKYNTTVREEFSDFISALVCTKFS